MTGMRFLVLSTGSKGNCTYVATGHSQVLIDCGIGIRFLESALAAHGIDWHGIDAVFATHMHSDHVGGIPTLLKHVPARVYAHQLMAPDLGLMIRRELSCAKRAKYTDFELTAFNGGDGFYHRDLDVLPVPVSHDCNPTVMYKLHHNGGWAGVLTDLGTTTDHLVETFGNCDALLLEANHCPQLLADGPYPPMLKQRIRGNYGHLSNRQAAEFATGLARMPRHLFLGHLSDENNTPAAASAAFNRVETGAIPHTVLPQRTTGGLVEL